MCCLAEFIVKYVLFFANLVFALAGAVFIGLGVALMVNLSEVASLFPDTLKGIAIAIVVLGSIVFAISFFGCCGAIRESRCLLSMYFVCMAILAAGKIYLVVVIFNGLNGLQGQVSQWIQNGFTPNDISETFALLQSEFKCCGTTGYESYGEFPLPESCCGPQSARDAACLASSPSLHTVGCSKSVTDYIATNGEAAGSVLIVVIIVELVAMLFGIFLCSSVSGKR
ncbi:hypothetical protein ACJJTC_002214 [Scirpophaga incertulas]